LKRGTRLGISRIALTGALIAVVAVAGIALYLTSAPPLTSSTTTASTTGGSLVVSMSPRSPLVAPGQTQNYSLIQVQTSGPELNGTLTVRAFAPAGITLLFEKTSVSLADNPQSIPLRVRASPGLPPGIYNFSLETRSANLPARNQTFTIDVVPVLVIIQNLAFHPQNLTVPVGTSVSWINLDSNIGCCDPGTHNVVFLTGGNASSPELRRFDTWSYTFSAAGIVNYYCSIHPTIMNAQAHVTA
jgi:plastocyanin